MKRILRHRPSPAMVVALVALFMSLTGSAFALVITGKQVKNGSLTGPDLRRNTLGGREVNESRLATVPRAKVADTVGGRTAPQVTTRGFFAISQRDIPFSNAKTTIGSLSLPPGGYVLYAKAIVTNSAQAPLRILCRLETPGDEDEGRTQIQSGNNLPNVDTLVMSIPHSSSAAFTTTLSCQSEGNPGLNLFNSPPFTRASFVRIVAIRTDELTIAPF